MTKRSWLAASVLAALLLGGCGEDEPEKTDEGAAAASGDAASDSNDKDAYCALVEEAADRGQPDPGLDGEITEESAKAIEEEFSQELAFTEKVVAAAPEDLQDAWQDMADVQEAVAEQGRQFLDPAFQSKYEAMSEDERLEFFFTEILGPFEDLDEKSLEDIGAHAESECGIKDLFDDAGA